MEIVIKSDGAVGRWADSFAGLSGDGLRILAQSLNREGRKSRVALQRATAAAVGTSYSRVGRVMRTIMASSGDPSFEVRATDRFMSLADFGPRETHRGVSAAPWGVRRVFPSTFTKGGRFPRRVPLGLGGQVYSRVGAGRTPLEKHYGPAIPIEMTQGDPLAGWFAGSDRIAARIVAELQRRLALGA